MGSVYDGYVVWKSGKATKYYAIDIDTTYRSVMRAADQMKLETTLIKSAPQGGYSLEIKRNPNEGCHKCGKCHDFSFEIQ